MSNKINKPANSCKTITRNDFLAHNDILSSNNNGPWK